jgi:hypothetical protein
MEVAERGHSPISTAKSSSGNWKYVAKPEMENPFTEVQDVFR